MTLAVVIISCNKGQDKNAGQPVEPVGKSNSIPADPGVSMHQAALEGDGAVIMELLSKGADVNKTDEDGRTAIMYAAYNGHTGLVNILLENKAFLDIKDVAGRTALMFAASGPFPETVKLLLDHQAEPNAVDFDEHFTALMFAASEGHLASVKILLDYKADPFMKDKDGDTALTFAQKNGHTEVAALLRELTKK
jgi:ankyrin repeat protein